MNKRYLPLALSLLLLYGCGGSNSHENSIVSQKYVHKFGYAVSKEDWMQKDYPGQVITTLSNGVTITSTYEGSTLHGPTTHTYPNSQTIHYFYLYDHGTLSKEIVYNALGMPTRERVQLSPHRYTLTMWYHDGTPMCIEDYADEELLDGEYMTVNNEIESRVEKGNGLRITRDFKGTLLSKDIFENGYIAKQETFYPSGTPESIVHFAMNKLHGEKRTFAESGEPLSIEEWVGGQLHGKSTYFANGIKQVEIHYLHGAKNGPELHYRDDGMTVAQEILWENDRRQGPTTYYVDGSTQTEWWYEGKHITQKRYEELDRLDQMISQIND